MEILRSRVRAKAVKHPPSEKIMFLDKKKTREEMRPVRMTYYAKDIMGWNEDARPQEHRIKLFANARARTVEIDRVDKTSPPTVLGSVGGGVWRWTAAGAERYETDAADIKALVDECN